MEVSHKARKIIEAEISNRPSDSAAALYAVLALDRAGLLTPDHYYRRVHANDQAEREQPNGNV